MIPQVVLQIIANVRGSPQVQALRASLSALGAQARQGLGNPFASLATGAAGAAAAFVGANAGLLTIAGTVAGIGAAFKAGLNINAEVESSTLGIKTLIASMYEVRDASGSLATGPEQLTIAGEQAAEQIQKLRIAGLETSATFQQLTEAFQQGIGAGAAAGLGLDQVRELTVGIVQAAGALNVPMHQLNQEVRSLLSGQISADSSVAKALQISNEQMKEWTKTGKVFDELQKKFEIYRRTGAEAATTWTATFSNMREAASMFLGTASKGAFDNIKKSIQKAFSGVFDVSTGGVSEQFKGLQELFTRLFDGIGGELAGAIAKGAEAAKDLSAWLEKNKEHVAKLSDNAGLAWDNFKGVAGIVAGVFGDFVRINAESSIWADALLGVARIMAKIQDGFTIIGAVADRFKERFYSESNPQLSDMYKQRADNTERRLMSDGALATLETKVAENERKAAEARIAADLAARRAANGKDKPKKTGTGGTVTNKPRETTEEEKKAAEREAKQFQKAQEELAKVKLEAVKKTAAALREAEQAQDDADLATGKMTHDQHMANRRKYQAEEYALELAGLKQQREVIAARATAKQSEILSKQSDLKKVDAEIAALASKDRTATIKLVADDVAFKRQVADLETEFRAKILDAQGDAQGAADIRRQAELRKQLLTPEFQASPDLRRDAARLNELEATKSGYEKARTAYEEHLHELDLLDKTYKQQVELGEMTTLDAEDAMRQARLLHVDAMAAELDMMIRLAAASKNPAMIAAAKTAKLELNGIAKTADSVTVAINKTLANSIVDSFSNLTSGGSRIKNFLRDILSAVADTVKKIAAQKLAEAIFGKIGGTTGGVGGYANAASGGFNWSAIASQVGGLLGFSEGGVVPTGRGGIIRGPGTGTSDSILARVSKDEGILTAAFTRKYGANTVYLLNQMAKGFSSGGIVGGKNGSEMQLARMMGINPAPVQQSPQAVNLRLINGITPGAVADHMDSAEGELVVENIITRNPTKFRMALGL